MALTNRGLVYEEELVAFADAFGETGGAQAMRQILQRSEPDALLASDDYLALGALRVATESGRPGLECVGFNNTQLSPHRYPPFSSVEIFPEQLGWHAARLILDLLENRNTEERHVVVPTRLILRGTLATAAPSHVP